MTETELSCKSKKHELQIPTISIQRISLAGAGQDWLAIEYELAGSSRMAYFGSINRRGEQNRVMLAIQNWMPVSRARWL